MSDKIVRTIARRVDGTLTIENWLDGVFDDEDKVVVILESEYERLKALESPTPDQEDICGYCGKSGADKMALWTGGGVYWPGEFRPDTELVHAECEQAETARAHAALSDAERGRFLRSIR